MRKILNMNIGNKKTNPKKASYVTKSQLQKSVSSLFMAFKLKETGQITENYVEFENFIPSITLNMSLIYKGKAPNNFDVQHWYNSSHYTKQLDISRLMNKVALDHHFICYLSQLSKTRSKRDRYIIVNPILSEDPNIIGYFFHFEYTW